MKQIARYNPQSSYKHTYTIIESQNHYPIPHPLVVTRLIVIARTGEKRAEVHDFR